MERRPRTQKGQAIVLVALMMVVLIGFVALAIDSARAFDARRVLQDSVDAAALAAAETYQNAVVKDWTVAQNNAITLFQKDNRLPVLAASCTPSTFLTPTPGSPGTAVVTTCTMTGAGSYVLTLSVADNGPAGQLFGLSATRPLSVALMQVLGQGSTINLTGVATATAADQSLTPALAGLSQAGCFGLGGTTPLNIGTSTSPYLTVVGDVVSNGAPIIGSSSYMHLGGDLLTGCGPPTNAANVTYECWPSGATPPCAASNVQGSLRSTANRFADPGYLAPPTTGLTTQPSPLDNVTLAPGIFTTDPQFGATRPACYFLPGGVYEWQAGMTVSGGLISNELKPPSEPGPNPPFWQLSGGNSCAGQLAATIGAAGENLGLSPSGNWPVQVTAVRTAVYNSVSYTRESAPSACALVNFPGPPADNSLVINISNVPGATSYNVYTAAPPANCAGSPLGLAVSIANGVLEKTTTLTGCPSPSGSASCTLGAVSGSFDRTKIPANFTPNPVQPADTVGAYAPQPEGSDFQGGTTFPAVNHARATYPSGDRANENLCATAAGTESSCPNAVTPGAVAMYMTNGSCFNVSSLGDAFLFSGYQYNWVLNYEPPATTCSNTWQGRFNSAPIGMSYTPGAGIRLVGNNATQTRSFGGMVGATILVQSAGALFVYFNSSYAPRPPGTRLTG
jgi:Flp pilus assembly protein TadG